MSALTNLERGISESDLMTISKLKTGEILIAKMQNMVHSIVSRAIKAAVDVSRSALDVELALFPVYTG